MSVSRLLQCATIPEEIRLLFGRSHRTVIYEEPELWRDVASRMVLDAYGIVETSGKKNVRLKIIAESHRWFKFSHEDVALVFEFAGMDAAPIRAIILKHVKATVECPAPIAPNSKSK